jgi:nucleoredoxin
VVRQRCDKDTNSCCFYPCLFIIGPPCRRFTPMLINLYNTMKNDPSKANTFELVFVSLDRQEGEFNEYISNMPWKCVPFSSDLRTKIAMKYGASGIPHLVVVEAGEDRKVITSEATAEVQTDPLGSNFPWKPKGFAEIWPAKVMTKEGLVDSSSFDQKHLLLYFSAHW